MDEAVKRYLADLRKQVPGAESSSDEGMLQYAQDNGLIKPEQLGDSLPQKALGAVGSALDYTGGLARVGAASVADVFTDKELVKKDDLRAALKGRAPMTEEYLERAGMPEGYSISDVIPQIYSETGDEWTKLKKGGTLDPNARDAAGLVGDVALDPLTYLSAGASAAAKASKGGAQLGKIRKLLAKANPYVNPVETLMEKGGAGLYKSAFKDVDTRLVEKGLAPVSPYDLERGRWGRIKSILADREKTMEKVLDPERSDIYKAIDRADLTIDPNFASREAREGVAEMASNPYLAPKAEKQLEFLDLAKDPMSVSKASDIKTSLYDALPDSAFDANGNLTKDGQKLLKDLAKGYKNEIEAAGEFVQPGMGKRIEELNKEWGAYLSADKPTRREISKGDRKNLLTQVKAALAATKPGAAIAMYGGQLVNSTPVRTGTGLLLNRTAQAPTLGAWTTLTRRKLSEEEK